MGNYNLQQLFRRYPNKLENMQFIVDGRSSEVKYPILAEAETPFAIIKARQKQAKRLV